MTRSPDHLPVNFRRNFSAMFIEAIFFKIGITFINFNTILPALARQLTTSTPLIGLSGAIFRGFWLLPQIAFAHLIGARRRKKPYMLLGTSGRVMLLVIGVALGCGAARRPNTMLAILLGSMAIFAALDACASVAWSDIVARAIPVSRRGRLMGGSQVISSIVSVGAGAIVSLTLGRLSFPTSYMVLFLLAAAFLIPAIGILAQVKEPAPTDVEDETETCRRRTMADVIQDPAFRRLAACRVLVALADLALPFYVGHAQDVLNLPARVIGYFVVAQTVSTVFASVGLAAISERRGPRHVAQIGGAAGAMAPLLALLLHISGPGWMAQLYPIIFVALGVINSTFMLGFFNYLIEIAPDDARPAFVGMSNTVLGLMTLVPILGGWLLNRTSYSVLFASAALASSLGFLMSLRLPSAEAANAWRATANRSTEEIRRQ